MVYKPHKIIRDRATRKKENLNFWKVFLIEGTLFLITSLLAIISAFKLNKLVIAQKMYLPTISLQDFIFSFLFVTFFVLLFVSYKKASEFREIIFKGFFIITVFWGGMTVLNLFLPTFGAIFVMGVLIFLWLEKPVVFIHDIIIILGLAGAASFFGLGFSPAIAVALLVIFSFYDFIAVYKTKHMIKMAKEMIDKKIILGFIVPREIKYFKDKLDKVKPGRVAKASREAGASDLGNFLILGGGDVVFPNLLAAAVVPSGFFKALIVVIFSLMGSLLSYWLFVRQEGPGAPSGSYPEPIPALPPVALLSIIGYFITLLIP